MSNYKYEMLTPIAQPGVAVRILERNEFGGLVGEYKGYYNFRRHEFTLYPSCNPYALMNGQLKKKTVYAGDVRYRGKEQ